jgi:hypothetical protein
VRQYLMRLKSQQLKKLQLFQKNVRGY